MRLFYRQRKKSQLFTAPWVGRYCATIVFISLGCLAGANLYGFRTGFGLHFQSHLYIYKNLFLSTLWMKGRTAISSKPETSRTKKACQDVAVIWRSILHLLSSFAVTIGLGCFTLLALGWTEVPGALGVGVFLLLLDTLKERICHETHYMGYK